MVIALYRICWEKKLDWNQPESMENITQNFRSLRENAGKLINYFKTSNHCCLKNDAKITFYFYVFSIFVIL